jgi:hypothetical protein
MKAIALLLWKCIRGVPVIFTHFPGPTLLLFAVAAAASAGMSSCVTHQLEAGARAQLEIRLAKTETGYAGRLVEAAQGRETAIAGARAEERAIAIENMRIWREAFSYLAISVKDQNAIARLTKSIEDLHHDPQFDCRRLPLPDSYLRSLYFEPWQAGSAAGSP